MNERPALLQDREKTHGSFVTNACISQGLKASMRGAGDWNALHPVHRESMEMIALKLSRILSGQAMFKDHWDDIAGYASLAAEVAGMEL